MDLSKLLGKINKELKGGAKIQDISEVRTPYFVRRRFGISSIDAACKGGLPGGTMCQLFGPDGSGKDYLSNKALACVQEDYGEAANIFWMSFGYKPDLEFMRMAGMKLAYSDDELATMGIDPATATEEQRGHTVGNVKFIDIASDPKALAAPAEYLLTISQRFIESGVFQMGVINELGSGETQDNTKKGLHEHAKMATFASLMSDFCRKMYTGLRITGKDDAPNETTIIAINPVRANLDANSAKYRKYEQGSGYALKHAKVIDIHLESMGFIWEKIPGVEKKVKIGKGVKWKIAKGKLGVSEGSEGEYAFYWNKGVDDDRDACVTAKSLGVIYNKGRYYYVYGHDDVKMTGGFNGVVEYLMNHPELMAEVKEMAARGVNPHENNDTSGPEG